MSKALELKKQRAEETMAEAGTLDTLCAHVADGGSLIDLCRAWEIRYCDAIACIYASPKAKEAYEQALDARAEWAIQRILDELRALALVDPQQVFDAKGRLKPLQEIPEATRRAIASIETEELYSGRGEDRELIGYARKVRLHDKLRALELLGKNLRLFVDRVEHEGRVTLADLVCGSYPEADGSP